MSKSFVFLLFLALSQVINAQLFFKENFEFNNYEEFRDISIARQRWTFFQAENQDFNKNNRIDDWENLKSINLVEYEPNNKAIRMEFSRIKPRILMVDAQKNGMVDGVRVDFGDFFNHVNRVDIGTWDNPGRTSYIPNREYTFEFSTLVPEEFEFEKKNCRNPENSNYEVIGQWRFTNAIKEKTQPPLSLRIICDTWYLSIIRESYMQETKDNFIAMGKIEKGKWVNWRFNFRLSYRNNGFIHVFKDGAPVYSEERRRNIFGPRTRDGQRTFYFFKMGIYKPHWWSRGTDVSTRAVLFDNVNVY